MNSMQQAMQALQARRLQDAKRLFERVVTQQPRHPAALNLLSTVLVQLGEFAQAERYVRRALKETPKSEATIFNYGIILRSLQRPSEALACFDQALKVNPNVAETWTARGSVLHDLKRYDEAVSDFEQAIALSPRAPAPWYGKGRALTQLKRYDKATAAFDSAIALDQQAAEALTGRGIVLAELQQHDQALAAFHQSLAIRPDLVETWLALADTLSTLRRYDDALAAYEKAIALNPKLSEAWTGRGAIYQKLRRYKDAFDSFEIALARDSALKYVEGARLHAKLQICDWRKFQRECTHLLASVQRGAPASTPFSFLSLPSSPAEQLQCAQTYVRDVCPLSDRPLWRGEKYHHDRLRIAYISTDLHEHPVALLTAGVFEQHDRSRFELSALSFGPETDDDTRQRLKRGFDRFIDVSSQSADQVADLMRSMEIDIAVDLTGLTDNVTLKVLARKPAPVQVCYLGYPGTSGADYIDGIVADPIVIPENEREYYSERVIYLPTSYLPADNTRPIAATPTRAQENLPEHGFVFCSFCTSYKLNPMVFDIWMRLLQQVPGSVLWLRDGESAANLRQEAERRGIKSDRLVFARYAGAADHLARHRLADLFLDTLPFNAHSSASDALWAGLPVLTCPGSTMAGRAGASLLYAIGMPELAATSLQQYEGLALKLAREPEFAVSIRERLAQNRGRYPLFNTKRYTRDLEEALVTMQNFFPQ